VPRRQRKTNTRDFEKQPFGELERFVTQKLWDVVKRVAKKNWKVETASLVARLSGRSYEEMRVITS